MRPVLFIVLGLALSILPAQAQDRRTLFDILFGQEEARVLAPTIQPEPAERAAPTAVPAPVPQVEKSPDATRLAVFGDSLAIDLAKALDRFYAEDPNLAVTGHAVGSSGFVRADYFDWNQAIAEEIAADSFDVAVIMIGINDHQNLRIGRVSHPPLSPDWRDAYRARIERALNQLRAARKPVIWLSLPPMSRASYASAMSQIAALQKRAAFSAGAEYLDIYERFLGEDGKYSSYGPDANGHNARMRKDDGIHFSSAGADKLAFYVSQSLGASHSAGAMTVADPLAGTDALAMLRPPYQGLGQTRLLEMAGAVEPLTRAPPRADELLLAAPRPSFSLERFVQAPAGRADAFGVGTTDAAQTPVP